MTDTSKRSDLAEWALGSRAVSRRTMVQGVGVAGVGLALAPGAARGAPGRARPASPNVIYISIDDLAWKELGCYGNSFNETPHIDRLAEEGLRFTDAYSAASICSPTRASLMTGRYPANVGITDFLREMPAPSRNYLSPEYDTIPSVLGEHGYVSGLVGKWHLTEVYEGEGEGEDEYRAKPGSPYAHGFDEVRVSETNYIGGGDYFYPYSFMRRVAGVEGEYLTDRLAQEAIEFIDAHRDQPFFLHLSNFAVHTTLSAKADLLAKYQAKPGAGQNGNNPALAAMLESVDEQVGAVMTRLEELGLADSTLVVVMSDNGGDGGATTNLPFRGAKSDLYEGGIRVAMVAHWPDGISPGRVSGVPASTVDIFPTVLDIAGIAAPATADLDGVSLVPTFEDGTAPQRDALYWVYPHFHFLGAIPRAAVRAGRYKLIQDLRDGRVELYDLLDDRGETADLADELPVRTADLRERLEAHVEATRILARTPTAANYQAVELAEEFDDALAGYTVLTRPAGVGAGPARVEDGALGLGGSNETLSLYRSEVSPGEEAVAITAQIRSFAAAGGTQDTVFVGLVKDQDNFVMVWHNNARKRTGWDAVVDGRTISGVEPLGALDGVVNLSAPGSRLSFVVDGRRFTGYAERGEGRWEFLFAVDIAEVLDLSDPAVRAEYRYGFGARVDAGTMLLERIEARRRSDVLAEPELSLRDGRIDADETTVAVLVRADGGPVTGGTVELRRGGRLLGVAEVDAGVAAVELQRPLNPGVYRLVAAYSGSDAVAPAEVPLTLRVVRGARRRSVVVARPRRRAVPARQRFRVDVRVRSGRAEATGQVVAVRRGRVVARGRLRRDGTAVLVWTARRPLGRQTLRVRYLGSADVAPSATTVTVRVERPRRRR